MKRLGIVDTLYSDLWRCIPSLPHIYRALSAHGRSYSYDEKASGFGRGEGAACLLVKRVDDAIRDGDPIHAVIRSSACNHGGRSEGITMPNGTAHRKLLWDVHEAVGLNPAETPVVEVCLHSSPYAAESRADAKSLTRGTGLVQRLGKCQHAKTLLTPEY